MDTKSKGLFVTLILIIGIIIGYFLLLPSWNDLSASRDKLAKAEAEKKELLSAEQELSDFLGRFNSYEKEAVAMQKALPNEPQMGQLLGNLDELAAKSGFVLSALNVLEGEKLSKSGAYSIEEVLLELDGNGTYLSFKDFLLRLENHLRVMDIEKVTFQTKENGIADFKFIIKTYYQK